MILLMIMLIVIVTIYKSYAPSTVKVDSSNALEFTIDEDSWKCDGRSWDE